MISILKRRFGLPILLVVSTVVAVPCEAVTLDFTAEFSPDPSKPMRNEFTNTTIQSGYCAEDPRRCVSPPMVSFRLPIKFISRTPIEPMHSERQGPMFNLPSHWQTLNVVHEESGDSEEVQVRVSGMGTTYYLPRDVRELVGLPPGSSHWTGHGLLWGSRWDQSAVPCVPLNYSGANGLLHGTFWRVPLNVGTCAKQAKYSIPTLELRYLDIGYELIAPKPLEMAAGVYQGSIKFPIGPGGIDVGDNMYPVNDNLIDLNFTLTVRHILAVDIPPGGNRIELIPQGGWQSWLAQGRKPARLFRDQTFNIWASSKFKMQMECQYVSVNTCALYEPVSGKEVPLNISVSLPNGLMDSAGQPISRRPLLRDGSGTELFQPGFYINRRPGTLHFEIARDQVEQMLSDGAAKQYSGNVTVIWDSEV